MRWSVSLLCCQLILNSLLQNVLVSGEYPNLSLSNETSHCYDKLEATHTRLRRRKRSLTFPKGSAFVLTMSIVKAIQLKEPANWNLDLEFDVIWPIPKWQPSYMRKPWYPLRRHRRELYANFELALDSQGLPGKECILRTICESKFILNPPGMSLVEDLIRVIFSYPSNGDFQYDTYDTARMAEEDCAVKYSSCPVSFLYLLLNSHKN